VVAVKVEVAAAPEDKPLLHQHPKITKLKYLYYFCSQLQRTQKRLDPTGRAFCLTLSLDSVIEVLHVSFGVRETIGTKGVRRVRGK
jgi:hypothetical protein